MTSPFSKFANSELTFNIPSTEYTVNSVGNRIFKKEELKITAILRTNTLAQLARFAEYLEHLPGIDSTAQLLEGYLVEPEIIPESIKFAMQAKAVINNIKGNFLILPIIQNPYTINTDYLHKIS